MQGSKGGRAEWISTGVITGYVLTEIQCLEAVSQSLSPRLKLSLRGVSLTAVKLLGVLAAHRPRLFLLILRVLLLYNV